LKFKVQHIHGTQNIAGDTFSRMFKGQVPHEPEISFHAVFSHFPLVFQDSAVLQPQDPELSTITSRLENTEPHPKYLLSKGVLYSHARFDHRQKVVVQSAMVPMLFDYCHTSPLGGHLGTLGTTNKIRENFIWKSMNTDVRDRFSHCRVCTLSKPAQNSRLGLYASEV
jgi:hypothetical protein